MYFPTRTVLRVATEPHSEVAMSTMRGRSETVSDFVNPHCAVFLSSVTRRGTVSFSSLPFARHTSATPSSTGLANQIQITLTRPTTCAGQRTPFSVSTL